MEDWEKRAEEAHRMAYSLTPGPEDIALLKMKKHIKMIHDLIIPSFEELAQKKRNKEVDRMAYSLKQVRSDVDKGELVTPGPEDNEHYKDDKVCNKEKEENRGSHYGLDFWKHIFSVGTTFMNVLHLEQIWNFSNLQDAFEEGGVLHAANNVYLFSSLEESFPCCFRTVLPVVVAVVSPFPPTHKIGMYSMGGYNKVVEMKRLGMHWDPYIKIKNRPHFRTGSSSWKPEPQIFVLTCADRKTTLERVKHFNRSLLLENCVPYFDNPLEKHTCVDIRYPSEPEPVVCKFDLEMGDLEEFTCKLIEAKELSEHHKDGFKEYVSIKLQEIQRVNDERSQRKVAAAFKNTRFYKFYPVPSSETPVTHQWTMSRTIKGYYGGAHGLF